MQINNGKKNLIFFSETSYIGGAEVYLQMLALSYKEQFNVRIAIPKTKGTEEFVNELRTKGIKVDFIKKYNIIDYFFYFRKIKPHYIHFNVPFPDISICTTAILVGIIYTKSKLYATEHMVPPEYKPHPFIKLIIKAIYSKLDILITVSNKNKEAMIKNFGLPGNKIKVIHNCIDIDYFKNYNSNIVMELRNKYSINDSSLVFGTLGRLDEQKGHEYLITASKNVIRKIPNSIFIFVGKGRLKDQLIQKIRDNNLEENFRVLGYQENLPEILALIDIFVLPSISEGFPFSLLEAMAAKKPIIATNVGGVSEIITNDTNGILVEPKDSDALARAMINLALDKKKLKCIAELGYQKIIESFSLEKMILNTKNIYI
jgi:glycosyltransferase involved in cell wall biosynthesis